METKSIKNFLSESQLISVPQYQRNYSWGDEQLEEFWNDINLITLNASDQPENKHFFGLIVLVKTNLQNYEYEVVDGQQRLTTTTILLATIRDIAEELVKSTEIQQVSRKANRINSVINGIIYSNSESMGKLKRRFTPNSHDSEYFNLITFPIHGEDFSSPHEISEHFSTVQNLSVHDAKVSYFKKKKIWNSLRHYKSYKAYKFFYTEIQSKINALEDNEKIDYLINCFTKCCDGLHLMIFASSNESEAFNLFETLNDRGLGLAAVDLIKNKVLKRSAEASRDEISRQWDEIFGNKGKVDQGSHNNFLRQYYLSHNQFITKQQIYPKYSEIINGLTDQRKIISWVNEFSQSADDYYKFKNIINQGTSFFADNTNIQNLFLLLKKTGSTQWYSIAFSITKALREEPSIKNPAASTLWLLLNLIIRFLLLNKRFNLIETKLPKIARTIWEKNRYSFSDDNPDEIVFLESNQNSFNHAQMLLIDLINTYAPDSELFINDSVQNSILLKDIDDNNLANLLLRLAILNQKQTGLDPSLDLTLEHVLPVAHKKWELSDDSANLIKYKIGNMVLIPGELNSSIKNSRLEDKSPVYIQRKIIDILQENNVLSFIKSEDWNEQIIIRRTEAVAEILKPMLLNLNFNSFKS